MTTIKILEKLIDEKKVEIDDDYQHWIIHHAWGEEGTFCYECGEKRRQKMLAWCGAYALGAGFGFFPLSEMESWNLQRLDGGFDCLEDDGPVRCEDCGKQLDYCLTDYGAEEEAGHFMANGSNFSPDDCYALNQLLMALDDEQQEELAKSFMIRGAAYPLWWTFD